MLYLCYNCLNIPFCHSKTYQLGKTNNFNIQLDDTSKKFTYFVPRDFAWNRMETRYPSAHKKMFMKDFGYHVSNRFLSFSIYPEMGRFVRHSSGQNKNTGRIRYMFREKKQYIIHMYITVNSPGRVILANTITFEFIKNKIFSVLLYKCCLFYQAHKHIQPVKLLLITRRFLQLIS